MAGEERERSFEKALARNLRAGAGERAGAARPDACARAETLAAYHERLLAPEEMTFWKEHIAGCARCQEILAHVEETEGIAVDAAERQESAVGARVEGGLAGYSKDVMAMPAARSGASVLHVAAPRRPKRWLWTAVVPAGAIAAGLLVWVAVNQREKPVEMARNQTAPVAVSSAPRSEATPASREAVPRVQAQAAPDGARRDESQSLTSELKSQAPELSSKDSFDDAVTQLDQRIAGKHGGEAAPTKKALRSPGPSAIGTGSGSGQGVVAGRAEAAAADDTNGILQEHERAKDLPTKEGNASSLTAVGGAAAPAAGPAAAPAPPPVPSVAETVVVESGAAPTPPSPAIVDALAKTKAGVGAPAEPKQGQQAQLQAQETQQMQGMSRFREKQDFRLANVKSPAVIAAPGGKVSWRVGVAGTIERSEDSGATWTLQSSGVVADLLAGSAVSEKVCWLAGRLGIILRTTDGGAHWVKVQAPLQDDIASVFAVSAEQATISAGRESYETTDGGATWKKLASQ